MYRNVARLELSGQRHRCCPFGRRIIVAGLAQHPLQNAEELSSSRQNWWIVDDHSTAEVSSRYYAAIEAAVAMGSSTTMKQPSAVRVAVNIKGDKLSRIGSIGVGTICFDRDYIRQSFGDTDTAHHARFHDNNDLFLVDWRPSRGSGDDQRVKLNERIQAFKTLLECEHVLKVMHDGRTSCDALYHQYGIRLKAVHDTNWFHNLATTGGTLVVDEPLHQILIQNGLQENHKERRSYMKFYKGNPHFWKTRPLNEIMIEWCTTDLENLLILADHQALKVSGNYDKDVLLLESTKYVTSLTDMELQHGIRCYVRTIKLIGPDGANLRQLMQRTQTTILQDNATPRRWMVYYKAEDDLNAVLREMGHWEIPKQQQQQHGSLPFKIILCTRSTIFSVDR